MKQAPVKKAPVKKAPVKKAPVEKEEKSKQIVFNVGDEIEIQQDNKVFKGVISLVNSTGTACKIKGKPNWFFKYDVK